MSEWLVRARLGAMARWCAKRHLRIYYQEVRPIPLEVKFGQLPFTTDCSGFVTMLAHWAGLPDPNGNGYSGYGYTGSLLAYLPEIPREKARRGDLAVFGAGTGEHVVMLLQSGRRRDPKVVSHGGSGDPRIYRLSGQRRLFPRGTELRYLRMV